MSEIPKIYDYSDYRKYLEYILSSPSFGRGARQKLAEHLSCQPSFISQVLSGKNELSLEHGYKVKDFLGLNSDETEFFMTMMLLGKAGSEDLRTYYRSMLEKLRAQKLEIEKLVPAAQLSETDILAYFGNWTVVSIHMLVAIEAYRNPEALFKKLGIARHEFDDALRFLLRTGLIQEVSGKLMTGEKHIHLKRSSPFAQVASVLTRLRVLQSLDLQEPGDVNYSLNFTISDAALAELRKRILEFISDLRPLIDAGTSTRFCTLILDLVEH